MVEVEYQDVADVLCSMMFKVLPSWSRRLAFQGVEVMRIRKDESNVTLKSAGIVARQIELSLSD